MNVRDTLFSRLVSKKMSLYYCGGSTRAHETPGYKKDIRKSALDNPPLIEALMESFLLLSSLFSQLLHDVLSTHFLFVYGLTLRAKTCLKSAISLSIQPPPTLLLSLLVSTVRYVRYPPLLILPWIERLDVWFWLCQTTDFCALFFSRD